MKAKPTKQAAEPKIQRNLILRNVHRWSWRTKTIMGGLVAAIGVLVYSTSANVPQPVLTITPLGTNQFSITVTNASSPTNYTLFWTPALADDNYTWVVLGVSSVGATNFMVDGGEWSSGWFRTLVGSDQDGDGVVEWMDAQPLNPSVGALSVTIDSPLNGSSIQ